VIEHKGDAQKKFHKENVWQHTFRHNTSSKARSIAITSTSTPGLMIEIFFNQTDSIFEAQENGKTYTIPPLKRSPLLFSSSQ